MNRLLLILFLLLAGCCDRNLQQSRDACIKHYLTNHHFTALAIEDDFGTWVVSVIDDRGNYLAICFGGSDGHALWVKVLNPPRS